jgi:hypothetical protein
MRPWERWTFNLVALTVAASGFAYFWMKYLIQTDDPFAVVNHPWQGIMLHLHVLASPPFVLIFGVVLNSHILKKLRGARPSNRKTGLASLATFVLMIVSGYLLQVATSEVWLDRLVLLHVASSTVFTITYGTHLIISYRLARRPERVAIQEVA